MGTSSVGFGHKAVGLEGLGVQQRGKTLRVGLSNSSISFRSIRPFMHRVIWHDNET